LEVKVQDKEIKELLLKINAKLDSVIRRLDALESKPVAKIPDIPTHSPVTGDIADQINKMREELMAKHMPPGGMPGAGGAGMGAVGMPGAGGMGAGGAGMGMPGMGMVNGLADRIKKSVPGGKDTDIKVLNEESDEE
jgi:PAB1-binding protein PBP1